MPRTHFLPVVCTTLVILCPSSARSQASDGFVQGLTQLVAALDGTFGDEGPALNAALDAMTRGLEEWDARVARVESGLRAEITNASPPVAAQMRATLGTVYLERGRIEDALVQFGAAVGLDPSVAQIHVLRGLAYDRTSRAAEAAAAYQTAWRADPESGTKAYLALRSQTTWQADSSYLGQNDLRVHFGVGEARQIERLDVRWPDGHVETIRDVAADQIVTVTEGRGITGRTAFSGR